MSALQKSVGDRFLAYTPGGKPQVKIGEFDTQLQAAQAVLRYCIERRSVYEHLLKPQSSQAQR